jgi:hypothetical protein
LHDGEAHVLIYGWQGGSNVLVSVDGYAVTCPSPLSLPMTQSRIILGSNEGLLCFKGDFAEIQFYRTALSVEQQTVLSLELAQRYGTEVAGFCADGIVREGPLASREVRIESGAAVHTATGGTAVGAGQVYTGGGSVHGTLSVGTNGVIVCGPTEALAVDNLVFNPGSVCRWVCAADGTHTPTAAGNVTLPRGTVVVDIQQAGANPAPQGTLLRYTGVLVDNGVTWSISGGRPQTKVVSDVLHKTLHLSTPTGTAIFVH